MRSRPIAAPLAAAALATLTVLSPAALADPGPSPRHSHSKHDDSRSRYDRHHRTPRPAVKIDGIRYDSPGRDTRANRSVNGEYLRIKNQSRRTVNLHRWTIRNERGHRYTFRNVRLAPGKTVTLRTGLGRDTRSTVYWDSRRHLWNNYRGVATLTDPRGKRADACSYVAPRRGNRGYTSC